MRGPKLFCYPLAVALLGLPADAPAAGSDPQVSPELSASEVAAAATPAVVTVRVRREGAREVSYGTGFLVAPGGTVVTALHVVEGAERVLVRTAGGERFSRVTVRAFDAGADVAVLQIGGAALPVVRLAQGSEIQSGDPVVVVGNPWGLERTVSEGIVSAWREPLAPSEQRPLEEIEEDEEFGDRRRPRGLTVRLVQLSAQVAEGTSGAPVFDRAGRVIGMAVGGLGYGLLDLNFAVPTEQIEPLLEIDEGLTLSSFARRLEQRREQRALPHVERARLALELRRDREARWELDAALQLHPHSAEALLLEGELLRREGDLVAAEGVLLHLTRRHPDSAAAWQRLGELYLELDGGTGHALGQARRSLEKALELDGEMAAATRELGMIAYRQGRLLSAVRLLEDARALADEEPDTAVWLGEVYLRLDRVGAARASFESALDLASDDPRAHHGLARACTALGHDGLAREHWKQFLDLTAGDPEFEALRARTVLYLRRYPHLIPLDYESLREESRALLPPS